MNTFRTATGDVSCKAGEVWVRLGLFFAGASCNLTNHAGRKKVLLVSSSDKSHLWQMLRHVLHSDRNYNFTKLGLSVTLIRQNWSTLYTAPIFQQISTISFENPRGQNFEPALNELAARKSLLSQKRGTSTTFAKMEHKF